MYSVFMEIHNFMFVEMYALSACAIYEYINKIEWPKYMYNRTTAPNWIILCFVFIIVTKSIV